jgi:flagellar biosynthesis/type III secretory pathway chaperone
VGSGHAAALEEAFKTERRLLLDLLGVLEHQRSGVAADDIAQVDESVFAAQRVLRTLAEARRRRRALLGVIVGDEGTSLGDLDEAMGGSMTLGLRTARDELLDAARSLARGLDRNRLILQGAISSGDRLLKALTGAPEGPIVYGAPGAKSAPSGTVLVNRQV